MTDAPPPDPSPAPNPDAGSDVGTDADFDDLLAFTPVPMQRRRADGWSAERQRRFITALSVMGAGPPMMPSMLFWPIPARRSAMIARVSLRV